MGIQTSSDPVAAANAFFALGTSTFRGTDNIVYETVGGFALEPKVIKGWKTYNFEVADYHTH